MSTEFNLTTRAWVEMIALGTIWGATFFFTALAIREMGPLTAVAFRLGFGALGLWAVVLVTRQPILKSLPIWAAFFVMGLLNNLIPFSLITWGQINVASGLASILNASTGVVGVVVAALLLADERLSARKSTGAIVAFCGVIITIGISALRSFDITSLSQLAILGAALSYALAGVWARKTMSGAPPIMAATGMVTGSAIMLWPIALIYEGSPSFNYLPSTWAALIYQGFMATTLAYLLYYRVLKAAGSGNLMLVTLLLPPIALILGAVFLNEVITPQSLLGFAIIAFGLLIIDGRILTRFGNTKMRQ